MSAQDFLASMTAVIVGLPHEKSWYETQLSAPSKSGSRIQFEGVGKPRKAGVLEVICRCIRMTRGGTSARYAAYRIGMREQPKTFCVTNTHDSSSTSF